MVAGHEPAFAKAAGGGPGDPYPGIGVAGSAGPWPAPSAWPPSWPALGPVIAPARRCATLRLLAALRVPPFASALLKPPAFNGAFHKQQIPFLVGEKEDARRGAGCRGRADVPSCYGRAYVRPFGRKRFPFQVVVAFGSGAPSPRLGYMPQRVGFRARCDFTCAHPIARVRQGFDCQGSPGSESRGQQKSSHHVSLLPLLAGAALATMNAKAHLPDNGDHQSRIAPKVNTTRLKGPLLREKP